MRIDHGDAISLEGVVRRVLHVKEVKWVDILMRIILNLNHLMPL